MEAAPAPHAAPREAVQAALKRIRLQHGLVDHQAAVDVLTVLELQDAQDPQRIVDEIQTRPDLVSSSGAAIRAAIRSLRAEGLVEIHAGSERVRLSPLATSCLSEARER